MTEEIKDESGTPEVTDTPEFTEVEHEALEQGWKPKSEWMAQGKPEDEWRPAKEFKERGELFQKIETLSQELKSTRSTMKALQGHYEKVKETEFKRALETLKQDKRSALEEGDVDAVMEIDDKIATVRETQRAQAAAEQAQTPEVHPEFVAWVSRNQWYSSDKEMQTFADSIGRAYALSKPGVQPSEVLKHVTAKVKQTYPEKFTNPRRSETGAADASSSTPSRKKADSFELTADEEKVMNKLVSQKVMTKEKYIEQIKAIRGDK